MSDILRFEPRRGPQPEEDPDDFVSCARCGRSILATATRCPECGVHFQGEAQDFYHASERPRGGRVGWLWLVVVLVLCVMLLIAFAPR